MQSPPANPTLAVGFDPGGTGAFGWAIVSLSGGNFHLEASGCVSGADEALAAAQQKLSRAPAAVGVDSPQYWVKRGDRQSDQIVRHMLIQAGGRASSVLHVNSLMGACLVQGALAAQLARLAWPDATITEAHPKALLCISKAAVDFINSLSQPTRSDHERDAALAAFAALHGASQDPDWHDLRLREREVWFPREQLVSYWFPRVVSRLSDAAPSTEVVRIAERVVALLEQGKLSLDLPREYQYASITLATIDAVYSIGVRYSGVRTTVGRYCEIFGLGRYRRSRDLLPPPTEQESVSQLCAHFDELGSTRMATEVFNNRQRTSTSNGILKAEAVWQFAQALRQEGIEYLQDVPPIPNGGLDDAIRAIPGQGSGISLRYFRMLTGAEDFIKPDRMILRFIQDTTDQNISTIVAPSLLLRVTDCLRTNIPHITPRLLDHAIWEYQRSLEVTSDGADAAEQMR